MKKKILALAFVAVMSMGLAKTADSCETVSVPCPEGMNGGGYGGWTGIVCEPVDYLFYMWYYCTEEEVDD